MSLHEKLRLAKIVLGCIEKEGGSVRWTPLLKQTFKQCGTPQKFRSIMVFLMKEGYIIRVERGVYQITERGEAFLNVL